VLTEQEAMQLITKAIELRDAERPVPSCVTVAQAAEMLKVSERTVVRMKLPRNAAGKIPYRAVLEALAASR
jgi:predicted DNA-binding transcriptional regulator YafY